MNIQVLVLEIKRIFDLVFYDGLTILISSLYLVV